MVTFGAGERLAVQQAIAAPLVLSGETLIVKKSLSASTKLDTGSSDMHRGAHLDRLCHNAKADANMRDKE